MVDEGKLEAFKIMKPGNKTPNLFQAIQEPYHLFI